MLDLRTKRASGGGGGGGGSVNVLQLPGNSKTAVMSQNAVTSRIQYTNEAPTPIAIGGIAAGTTFENVAINDMLTTMLYPYQSPAFTSFSISGLGNTNIEVGDSIPAGSKTVTWAISSAGNVLANTLNVYMGATKLANNVSITSPTNIVLASNIVNDSPTTLTWKIEARNSNDKLFSRTTTTSWLYNVYLGESEATELDENGIKALRYSALKNNINGTYDMEAGGYKYFAYPVYMGRRDNNVDPTTNFEFAVGEPNVVSVTNAFGISTDYYVYRSTNMLGGAVTLRIQ